MSGKQRVVRQAGIVREFAGRLRDARQSRGLTQRELANEANVTFTYISRLEAGASAPGIDTLDQLARALQVHVTDLLPVSSTATKAAEVNREHTRKLFDTVLKKGGNETLAMLDALLARLAESPTVSR